MSIIVATIIGLCALLAAFLAVALHDRPESWFWVAVSFALSTIMIYGGW